MNVIHDTDPLTGAGRTRTFYDGILFTSTIFFSSSIAVSTGRGAFTVSKMVPHPVYTSPRTYTSRQTAGVYSASVLVASSVYLSSSYCIGGPVGYFLPSKKVWLYPINVLSEPRAPAVINDTDPLTGAPRTRTFYPSSPILVKGIYVEFSGTPRYGRAELEVQFTDETTLEAAKWFWDFGDGNTSNIQHPLHTYRKPGVYDVELLVWIENIMYSKFKARYIVVWPGGLKVANTDKCWSLALKPEQGIGWREFGGPGWVFPESRVGLFSVFSDYRQQMRLITDARTGKTYRFATRNGPKGSGVIRRAVDRHGDSYGSKEIPWAVRFREHTGDRKYLHIRHLLSHFNVEPEDHGNAGNAGYDSIGYRENQRINLKIYVDGRLGHEEDLRNLPINGEIAATRVIDGRRVQLYLSGSAAELRITSQETDYVLLEKSGPPADRNLSEYSWQSEFDMPLVHFGRNVDKTLNLATGTSAAGSVYSDTTGPDNQSTSAMVFSPASSLSDDLVEDIDGDWTFMSGLSSVFAGMTICTFGTMTMEIMKSGSTYTLRVTDDGTVYDQVLQWSGANWLLLKVSRSGQELIISEDGAQTGAVLLTAINTYAGTFAIPAGASRHLYDVWLLPSRISEDAFAYYNRDIREKNGEGMLF